MGSSRAGLRPPAAYVAAELLKEVPYYAGAFGATLVLDDVSGVDAVVFLAGTNIGAAIYEYGVARVTQALLRRRLDSSGAVVLGYPNNHVAGVRARAEEPKPDDLSQRHPRRAAGGARRR